MLFVGLTEILRGVRDDLSSRVRDRGVAVPLRPFRSYSMEPTAKDVSHAEI